jgi:DNA replication and repair protein RecF
MKVIYLKRPFAAFTRDNINKDRALQYTSVGTHKDDLSFEIDGQEVWFSGAKNHF